jgi:hypothetical protein
VAETRVRERVARSLPWIVGLLTAAYQLAFPLVIGRADESVLLVGATRIMAGDALYRDFFEFLTPLGFYFHAAVFAIGGTTLLAARVAAAVANAVTTGLVFALARRIAGPLEAAVAALMVAVVCLPAWPYASPHWLSTTLQLGVASVLLSERLRGSSRVRTAVAGVLGGTAFCVQQQRGVYIAAWAVTSILVLGFDHPSPVRWRTVRRELAWFAAGGVGATVLVLGYAAWASSPRALYDALVRFVFENYGGFVRPVPWASWAFLAKPWFATLWPRVFRWAPALLVVEGMTLLHAGLYGLFDRQERVRLCLLLLAMLSALSVRYFPDYIHVAYVMPFLLMPAARVLNALRSLPIVPRSIARGTAICLSAALLVVLLAEGGGSLARTRAAAPLTIDTPFGRLQGDAEQARLVAAVRSAVDRDPPGERLLYAFPGDAWLYLATGARNATPFAIIWPGYNSQAQFEQLLADVQRRRPGTLVVNTILGPDGDPMRRALERDYDVVAQLPGYRVYRRHDLPAPAGQRSGPPPSTRPR